MTIDAAVIERVCSKWDVSRLRVFGSIARGSAGPESDLDLLVEFSGEASLFDLIGMQHDLEDELGVEVDLLTPGGLSPYIRDTVLSEAKVIYERSAA
jgi:predicted nucleotidyltransferase